MRNFKFFELNQGFLSPKQRQLSPALTTSHKYYFTKFRLGLYCYGII